MPEFSLSGSLRQPMAGTEQGGCLQETGVENGFLVLFINLALPISQIPLGGMTILL
jgi:hypothetical protein